MPVPMPMLAALAQAEYRPITLASYDDLIGGVRYVSIETLAGHTVTQLTPADYRSIWNVWEFDGSYGWYESNERGRRHRRETD